MRQDSFSDAGFEKYRKKTRKEGNPPKYPLDPKVENSRNMTRGGST
jgi:hypothetical protein